MKRCRDPERRAQQRLGSARFGGLCRGAFRGPRPAVEELLACGRSCRTFRTASVCASTARRRVARRAGSLQFFNDDDRASPVERVTWSCRAAVASSLRQVHGAADRSLPPSASRASDGHQAIIKGRSSGRPCRRWPWSSQPAAGQMAACQRLGARDDLGVTVEVTPEGRFHRGVASPSRRPPARRCRDVRFIGHPELLVGRAGAGDEQAEHCRPAASSRLRSTVAEPERLKPNPRRVHLGGLVDDRVDRVHHPALFSRMKRPPPWRTARRFAWSRTGCSSGLSGKNW